MIREAKGVGQYHHEDMGTLDTISIVTIQQIVEDGARLTIPMSLEMLTAAKRAAEDKQLGLNI